MENVEQLREQLFDVLSMLSISIACCSEEYLAAYFDAHHEATQTAMFPCSTADQLRAAIAKMKAFHPEENQVIREITPEFLVEMAEADWNNSADENNQWEVLDFDEQLRQVAYFTQKFVTEKFREAS